jgi:hypothetical protein
MAGAERQADGLGSVADLTDALAGAVAPFVRYEHPQGRLALSVFATRPRVPHAANPVWSAAADGVARVELATAGGGEPSILHLRPGRLVVDDGFVTLRTRFRADGPNGAATYAPELLDGIFGYVKRPRESAPETRFDDGVLVWERPVNRCEVLLVLQRALGRPLSGAIPFRFADDRIVLDLDGQEDPRWETTGGLGVFDPWPFAVWLARRHVKLQRPALRVAIEPERATPAKKEAAPARKPAPKRKAAAKTKAAAARTRDEAPAAKPARKRAPAARKRPAREPADAP